MARVKEADYLYISTRIKAMPKALIPYDRLLHIAGAENGQEAVKALSEEGWEAFEADDLRTLEDRIDNKRDEAFALLSRYVPDRRVVDVFKIRYDYHNIKTLVKSTVLQTDESGLYANAGTVPTDGLTQALATGKGISPEMKKGYDEALAVLEETGDPQKSDMILDAALSLQTLAMAKSMKSAFFTDYAKLVIDAGNLRTFVRLTRLYSGDANGNDNADSDGSGSDAAGGASDARATYLDEALLDGGSVSKKQLLKQNAAPADVIALFRSGLLKAACEEALLSLEGEAALTALDKACDNAVIEYMRGSYKALYGHAHIASFLFAKEQEFTAIRTIMTCFKYGMQSAEILEKLRYSYV